MAMVFTKYLEGIPSDEKKNQMYQNKISKCPKKTVSLGPLGQFLIKLNP